MHDMFESQIRFAKAIADKTCPADKCVGSKCEVHRSLEELIAVFRELCGDPMITEVFDHVTRIRRRLAEEA